MSAEFDAFIANMPVRLPAFVADELPDAVTVEDDSAEDGSAQYDFLKDYSPQSLPYVEAFALSELESPEQAAEPEYQAFSEGVLRYVGEVFLRAFGGRWDFDDPGADPAAMPFIRPDSATGNEQGEPVDLVQLLMTALSVRSGDVFISAYAEVLEGFDDQPPRRSCTGLEGTVSAPFDAAAQISDGERDFLADFLPTVEPAIAEWVDSQAGDDWNFDRASLDRLGRQLQARYDTVDELIEDAGEEYLTGAMSFAGEALRRAGRGAWRYGDPDSGAFEDEDPRLGQPYLQFAVEGVDVVPMMLLLGSIEDADILPLAYDALAGGGVGEAIAQADAQED